MGKLEEIYLMRENYARDALKVRVNREIYWKWENFVKDVLKVRNICKSCTECGKIIYEMCWMWEN